jgi:hypothetical protein
MKLSPINKVGKFLIEGLARMVHIDQSNLYSLVLEQISSKWGKRFSYIGK